MSAPGPRVVHIVQHLKSGGAEVLVRALARGLRDEGVDARFVSIYPDKLDDREREELGVPLATIGRRSRADLGFFGKLRAQLRLEHADIVHAHLSAGKYAGRLAAVLEHVPAIVFTEHDDERSGPIPFAINRYLHARTQRIITFSEEHRRRLAHNAHLPLEKIVVIPNGVAEPPAGDRAALRAELGVDPDAFALYVPARLEPQKNQTLAIRALALLGRERPDWRLVLAGSGSSEAELRSLAAELDVTESVHFLGYRNDAARLLRAMDVFAMPSLDERMPLALGEAMRAELAVVSTPWKGARDFVSDGVTGFVSAGYAVEEFADALRRARDDGARRAVASRAKSFADERFDLRACVRSHIELYEDLYAETR